MISRSQLEFGLSFFTQPSMSAEQQTQDDASSSEFAVLASKLINAAKFAPVSEVRLLLQLDAPAWYQDEELGWSCLHYAAERREPALLELLLQRGAVWNAVDHWGRTAGEICLSLGDQIGWEIIRNQGIRTGGSGARLYN